MQRDPAAVAEGMTRWLRDRRGGSELDVTRCERPAAGLSSETLMLDVLDPERSAEPERLVVRLAPSAAGIFPGYDLAVQARAQEVAAAGGVPTAVPVDLETDPQWLGAPFLVMPAVAGHIPGSMPLRDPWVTESPEAAATVSRGLYDILATLHRIDWRAVELDRVVPSRDLDAELASWQRYLDWYGAGEVLVPALADALAWCTKHRPAHEPPPSFLWGDVRLGNIVFDDARRPAAVLDWEMTSIGAAEHDLAWHLTLEATQNELFGRSVPGFLDHDDACAHYEAQAGRSLVDLEWYEVFAMVRSIAIMTRLAYVQEQEGPQPGASATPARQSAGRDPRVVPPMLPIADNPLLDLLSRRIATANGGAR
ncbi:MAG TPA: phosphotransferase family protein [Acidimicrobiia bacterium]